MDTIKRTTMRNAKPMSNDIWALNLNAVPKAGMQNIMAKLGLTILLVNMGHDDLQLGLVQHSGDEQII